METMAEAMIGTSPEGTAEIFIDSMNGEKFL